MTVVFFSLGGGCLFFVIFLLFMLSNMASSFCENTMAYLIDNTLGILLITGIISLLIALFTAYINKKIKWIPATWIGIVHFLWCTAYGVYGVIKVCDNSFFLLLISGVFYLAITVLHAIITCALLVMCTEKDITWPIYPICIIITFFLYYFY